MAKALAVIFVAGLCIWYGVERGEVFQIFNKAVHICLECVGLG